MIFPQCVPMGVLLAQSDDELMDDGWHGSSSGGGWLGLNV